MEKLLVYNKLIKQRNELLKTSDSYKEKLFEVIDEKLAELQTYIIEKRKWFLMELEKNLKEINSEFSITLKYHSFVDEISKENILKKYKEVYPRDKEKMVTSVGVHRDDFTMYINNIEIANYASQGEQRYCVLFLKLALAKLIKEKINKDPIIILDDVFSELDDSRKEKVYKILKEYEQVFISGCQNEMLDMTIYNVENAKVKLVKEELK